MFEILRYVTSSQFFFILATGSATVPLVMMHGMGAGLALFCHNYPSLVNGTTVYAIDLPGFGRSSRVPFR